MSFKIAAAASLAAFASTVSAHGFLSKITVGGTEYPGYNHNVDSYMSSPPQVVGWSDDVGDNGFVSDFTSPDIICHRGSQNAALSAKVNGGESVKFTWSTWPEDHRGPVITYLANCNGDCSKVDKNSLKWFKIDAAGLIDGDSATGTWASNKIATNGFNWDVTIPDSIASGNYVARHELIALHNAKDLGMAQNYPQCVNLEINSSGSDNPEGVVGTQLYTAQDKGLLVDIWWPLFGGSDYSMPGPALYTPGSAPAPSSSAWSAPASTSVWQAPAYTPPAASSSAWTQPEAPAWTQPSANNYAAVSSVYSAPPAPEVTPAPAPPGDDVVYVTDYVYATAYTTVYTPERRHAARHARLRHARK